MHKVVYLVMFILVNMWTISIHDRIYIYKGNIINGAEHHTIHHSKFNYNYGQYFTFWDRICGTHLIFGKKKKRISQQELRLLLILLNCIENQQKMKPKKQTNVTASFHIAIKINANLTHFNILLLNLPN